MSLIKCLYCGEYIYEYAKSCPKCGKSYPTVQEIKNEEDKEKEFWQRLDREAKCEKCGAPISAKDKFWRKTCKNCGYSGNNYPCIVCGGAAEHYDSQRQGFFCRLHLIEKCEACGELISSNKRFETTIIKHAGGTIYHAYHEECLENKYAPKHSGCLTVVCVIFLGIIVNVYFLI